MSKTDLKPQTLLDWLKDLTAVSKQTKQKDLESLTRLDLSNRKLEYLHDDIGRLKQLSYLNLSNNALKILPQSFDALAGLISLNLRRNQLEQLPLALGTFPLRSLNISGNKLEDISMLASCQDLRTIDLSGNFIHTLDGIFDRSANLRSINAELNLLTSFEAGDNKLSELEILNLSSNRLTALPKNIGQLENLSHLNLSSNMINDDLRKLAHLELESLDMGSNALKDLYLEGLSELQNLVIDDNALESVSVDPGFATKLKSFSAQGCNLVAFISLPSRELAYLCLSSNLIDSIPASIVNYSRLHELDIDDNEISLLPQEFSHLESLNALYIEGNPLQKISRLLIGAMDIEYCDIFVKKDIMVRKAQFDDLKPMARLLAQLFAIESDFVYDYEKHYGALKMMYNHIRGDLLVAKYRNRVIGMVTMQELISSAQGGVSGQIEDLIVDSGFRKMGVGTRLVRTVFDIARERNYVRIQLAADKDNHKALRFYRQRGFDLTNLNIYHYTGLEQ